MNIHEKFIKRTFELAIKGEGKVEPNPLVGAIVVKNGKIIGEGYHKFFGGPHAEVYALKNAGKRAVGATLYLNLEPCCHFGKTPPCTDLIIKSGIKEVFISCEDPNPVVHCKGIKILKSNGIKVVTGILKEEAKRLNAPFFKMHLKKLPYVISKWAMTLDGKIATRRGDSKWISSEEAREYVKKVRSKIQAVIIGIETALRDDPHLLALNYNRRTPTRIILDSNARLPLSSYLIKTARRFRTIVCVSKNATQNRIKRLEDAGCEILLFNKLNMKKVFHKLALLGFAKVMLEGGGKVNASAFEDRLVDEILVFVSPKIIGGKDAKTPVDGLGFNKMDKATLIKDYSVKKVGKDIMLKGFL